MSRTKHDNFPHQRLDAWGVSLELAQACKDSADVVPRGYRSFADQLLRAGASAGANFVEGANRRTAGEKRNAFGKARGEAGEAAGHAEMLATLGLLPWDKAHRVMDLADRLCAVLTKLLQRWS
jgi:four helix bundle protein